MRTNFRGLKGARPLLLCAALFGLAGHYEASSQPAGIQHGYLVPHVRGNQAISVAAGEFRVVIANLLWDKVVDHYHHVFMAQGGDWSKNVALLPLLHTITELDPHFTQAYELEGGTILPRTGHIAEGHAVLAEGLRQNPNDWEMYREVAMLYAWTERKPALALPYARAGLAQADDDFSRHLMGMLCHTLEDQVKHGMPVMASGRPVPAPAEGAAAGPSPRSASG